MIAVGIRPSPRAGPRPRVLVRSHAVQMLQAFAITLMVFPSDAVIRPIGAAGYPAGLVGLLAFGVWCASTLFGLHNPLRNHHPVRFLLFVVWVSALVSYILMDRRTMTEAQLLSADRFLMQLVAVTGIALVAAEGLRTVASMRRVLRALSYGGAFCGVVAALQFWLRIDITPYLRSLPGFTTDSDYFAIMTRGSLNRVAGTALHPIELGVTAGMILPLAVYVAIHDTGRVAWKRWLMVGLMALAIPAAVSRSAVIAVAVSFSAFIVLMPVRQRLGALIGVPFALAGVFMSAHGLIGTLTAFFRAGTSDPSVATRVNDYPLVERLVREAPWFGHGGGTYFADNAYDILDNQYLKTAIELGMVGFVALVLFFLVPLATALTARRRTRDPELRLLCSALVGAALTAAVCSVTFDSFSFPMIPGVHALVIGLIGACWRLTADPTSAGHRPAPSPRIVLPAGA